MKNKIIYIFIIAALLWSPLLIAQVNTDSIFDAAIQQAKNKEYNHARINAKKVFKIHPDRQDVAIFIANVYGWDGKHDSAKIYIKKAHVLNRKSKELYDTWLNVLLWNGEYKNLLKIADQAERYKYKDKYNLILKRCYAYKNMGEYGKGVGLFDYEKNKPFLDSIKVYNVYRDMLKKDRPKAVSGMYTIDFFNDGTDPHHLAYIDYAFKIKRNTAIVRLNYANRFGENGLQIEADYYHLLKKRRYLYFNYGKSLVNSLFPIHRAGAEYYFPLKKNFEASIGARYLYFTSNHVAIITGHLGKYYKSFWFSLRPYYTIQEIGNSIAIVANARKYGKDPLEYWGLELAYGNNPDERYLLDPSGNYLSLNSFRVKVEKNIVVRKRDEFRISLGISHEETFKNKYRDRVSIELIYKHRL